MTHSFLGLRQTISGKKEEEEEEARRKVLVFCLPPQSHIKSAPPPPQPPSGWVGGTTCRRALMDSLRRCVSGRSKDAIMPVMAVGAKTGTHQDESKRSVRGAEDAAAAQISNLKSGTLTTPSVTAPHLPSNPPQILSHPGDGLSFPDYHHFRRQTLMFHGLFCL